MKWYFALLLTVIATSQAAAQNFSIQATVGRGKGHTNGEYRENGSGLSADLVTALRFNAGAAGGVVMAGSVAMQGTGEYTTVCILASNGGCVPVFPEFLTIAAHVGYEIGSKTPLRVLFGPAYVTANDGAFGVQARADWAMPIVSGVSFAASGRATLIPDYRGDTFRLYGFGFGLRVGAN